MSRVSRPQIHRLKVTAACDSTRLDQAIEQLHPGYSKSEIRKWIAAGAVYLNGKNVRTPSRMVRSGSVIELQLDERALRAQAEKVTRLARGEQVELTTEHILFEDDDLIVVNKPAGLPTQATLDPDRDYLYASVQRYLLQKGHSYVGLHHRLDRDTSGVVVMTKSKRSNASVAAQFAKHDGPEAPGALQKIYWAVALSSDLPWSNRPTAWTIENFLGRLEAPGGGKSKRARFGAVRSGGDHAKTDFRVMVAEGSVALVEARPLTGRTHQIRTHLETSHAPILGDESYGGHIGKAEGQAPRVMLHARTLTFTHPIHTTLLSLTAPLPLDFEQCLRSHRLKIPARS